jgi:hypothetical protein
MDDPPDHTKKCDHNEIDSPKLTSDCLALARAHPVSLSAKCCRREDLAPSLAMSVSLSHLTETVVPIFGAALSDRVGYQFSFLFCTSFIFLSLYSIQKIDVKRPRIAGAA